LWNSYSIYGDGLVNLKDKLKILKMNLKKWNKEVFGYTSVAKVGLVRQIEDLDKMDEHCDLNGELRTKKKGFVYSIENIKC